MKVVIGYTAKAQGAIFQYNLHAATNLAGSWRNSSMRATSIAVKEPSSPADPLVASFALSAVTSARTGWR